MENSIATRVLLLGVSDAGSDKVAEALSQRLAAGGHTVSHTANLSAEAVAELCIPDSVGTTPVVVVPDGPSLSVDCAPAIRDLLRSGGRLLLLRAPLWPDMPLEGADADHGPVPSELLWPAYKFFPVADVASLAVRADQHILSGFDVPLPRSMTAHHPRPKGGFDKGRTWRWFPLVEARSADGVHRGHPASAIAHVNGEYAGSAVCAFSVDDAEWYLEPAVLDATEQVVRWLARPTYLLEGGASQYTYLEGTPLTVGLRATTHGRHPATARVTVTGADGLGRAVLDQEITIPAGEVVALQADLPAPGPDISVLRVTAELLVDGAVLDRLAHDVHIWRPSTAPTHVAVDNDVFLAGAKPWKPHGVNYMPSSGVATEDFPLFHQYLGARAYDPEVIDRDLDHIADLGLNAVSIFAFEGMGEEANLLDLLRRIGERGLKANLSLRPSGYGEQQALMVHVDEVMPRLAQVISHLRLEENDAVFAYDLVWEPNLGSQSDRRVWDERWRRWLVERYGSLEAAEADWGFPAPRTAEGVVTNPSGEQMRTDGAWTPMVAAYRRFLDLMLYKQWSRAREIIKESDGRHLVSFRMWHAGDPTFQLADFIPYDFPYLAAGVDFLAPEAYGRIGDWEKVKPGRFTFSWGQLCRPDRPLVWAEIGQYVSGTSPTTEQIYYQLTFYRAFHRMLLESGAGGVFYWFFPGGYRCDDTGRDYGILNPDGTDRAVTELIRQFAPQFASAPGPTGADHWIEVDRDASAAGLVGLYRQVASAYWTAIEQGRTPGLRTAGTGTDSSNCPLTAVGALAYTGSNPPQHLDAAIDSIHARIGTGDWQRLDSVNVGEPALPADGRDLTLRVRLTNLGQATWLEGTGTGAVHLTVSGGATEAVLVPLPHPVPHLGSAEITVTPAELPSAATVVTLGMTAKDRADFGERIGIRTGPVV